MLDNQFILLVEDDPNDVLLSNAPSTKRACAMR
jgi:hypothetical protein